MDIDLADVTIHIDQELDPAARAELEEMFRRRDGIISAHFNEKRPHLMVCEFMPEKVNPLDLLSIVRFQGYHGELVGL
ncbi:MAG: ATP-binding protein [Pseudomonadota bacterium]|nr:ATP-binding protein [Pseudomonadota bacterium]